MCAGEDAERAGLTSPTEVAKLPIAIRLQFWGVDGEVLNAINLRPEWCRIGWGSGNAVLANWNGVTVDSLSRVVELRLGDRGLAGALLCKPCVVVLILVLLLVLLLVQRLALLLVLLLVLLLPATTTTSTTMATLRLPQQQHLLLLLLLLLILQLQPLLLHADVW